MVIVQNALNKYTRALIVLVLFLPVVKVFSQNVGINTTSPDPSAAVEISSTSAGLLIPRLLQTQRDAIVDPATGLLIFQTDGASGFYFYTGTAWTGFGGQGWDINGQAGTDSDVNFIGTTDNQGFSIGANGDEALRATPSGNLGIGETNPTAKLHISGVAPVLRYEDGNESNNAFLSSDAFGNSFWRQFVPAAGTGDEDWLFQSGSTTASPIFHQAGGVVIGRTGTTVRTLDIDNGANEGTTFGIGDIEFIRDGNNETQFSHSPVPLNQAAGNTPIDLGSDTILWNTIYAVNGVLQTSDQNLKKDVENFSYGTEDLMKLRPVSFLWKEEKRNNIKIIDSERESKLGFIAQEVQEVIPEVVKSTRRSLKDGLETNDYEIVESDYLGITYTELIPLLIKVKQEQDEKIKKLLEENKQIIEKLKK